MSDQWQERLRPIRLERRYEFQDYDSLRIFLDKAADLSEQAGLYPDMGFGQDYVNMTIHVTEGSDIIEDEHRQLADNLDKLNQSLING